MNRMWKGIIKRIEAEQNNLTRRIRVHERNLNLLKARFDSNKVYLRELKKEEKKDGKE